MSNPSHIRTFIKLGISLVAVVVLLAGWGIFSRMRAQDALAQEARQESAIPVMVTKPSAEAASEDLILPGTLQAFTDTPIYARTNGYLKRWLVDIGTTVKAGQLLAEIDTPEVDQQVLQAEADLQTAEANNDLAQLTAKRWKALLATKTVSQQDADNKIGDAAAKQAALASARANLHRLRELESFKRIVAPFDGVITARNIDVGDLIDAGTGSGKARELFHMAAIRRLRVYAQVPESYAQDMGMGDKAELQVREHPGRVFEAKLLNTANAIDPASHTLLVQLEVDNASGALLPGGYGEVHFKLKTHPGSLRVSANSLLFRPEGMQVAVVGQDNKVVLQTVTMGRDFGKEVEVLAGLSADQSIILNPSDSLVSGQAVKPQTLPQTSRNGK
ncbi:MAG: efflux RND transporter periplasmic adaptor subunit [Betaproteobacteria bacterium]|nr:efflux RND transporter periplasmic adaptor subunit [Betaproteobacteria bacterium]